MPTEVKENSIGLHFSHNPMLHKKDYDPLTWEVKKQHHNKQNKNLCVPEASPQPPIYEEYKVSFDKGTKFSKGMPNPHNIRSRRPDKSANRKPSEHPMQLRGRNNQKAKIAKGLVALGLTMLQFTT